MIGWKEIDGPSLSRHQFSGCVFYKDEGWVNQGTVNVLPIFSIKLSFLSLHGYFSGSYLE